MSTTTANLGLTLPTPNVDSGWGGTLNTDFTLIDDLFAAAGSGTSVGLQVGSGKTLNAGGTIIAGGTMILGSGDGTGTVTPPTIRGAARTGTNAAGGNLTIDAINGTGTGGSGSIIFRTAPAAASGTTANTMASRLEINAAGAIGVSGANYGTTNQVLISNGSAAAANWGSVNGSVINLTGQTRGDILYRGASAWERLPAGTTGQLLQTKGSGQDPQWVSASPAPNVIIQDQKPSGTDGGTFTAGSPQARTLNTLVRNAGTLASLASNRFTLPAGTYYIEWEAPAYMVDRHQTTLYNFSTSSTVARGSSEFSQSSGFYAQTSSYGCATITIASSNSFEIRHQCTTTRTVYGYGFYCGFGTEIYTTVKIWLVPA